MSWNKNIVSHTFQSISLRIKIILYYSSLIVLSISISVIAFKQINAFEISRKVEQVTLQGIQGDNRNINMLIEDINNFSKSIIANESVQRALKEGKKGQYSVNRFLAQSINFNPKIASIYLFNNDGHRYYTEKYQLKHFTIEDIKQAQWYNEVKEKNGGYIIKYNGGGLFREQDEQYITFIRMVRSLTDQAQIGILFINIHKDTIAKVLGDGVNAYQTFILIKDGDFDIVMEFNNTLGLKKEEVFRYFSNKDIFFKIVRMNRKDIIVNGLNNKVLNWRIIKLIPFTELILQSKVFTASMLFIIMINGFFILIGSIWISKRITNPIHLLIESMRGVENGIFKSVVIDASNDEIGQLKRVYNIMIDKIQELINRIITEQKMKRKAELDVLMEQIKPHFLYNTLDSISSLVMMGRKEEVYSIISALGNFYRTSLNNGQDIITVEEEVQTVKNYLYIQKTRYAEMFEVEYEVDANLLRHKVPKMILQPLVENSIYHGIRTKGEKGLIILSVKKVHAMIQLVVEDNGIGMTKEKIDQVMRGNSIGLKATMKRIEIIYGQDSSFAIQSEAGKGTKVIIRIPIERNGTNV